MQTSKSPSILQFLSPGSPEEEDDEEDEEEEEEDEENEEDERDDDPIDVCHNVEEDEEESLVEKSTGNFAFDGCKFVPVNKRASMLGGRNRGNPLDQPRDQPRQFQALLSTMFRGGAEACRRMARGGGGGGVYYQR